MEISIAMVDQTKIVYTAELTGGASRRPRPPGRRHSGCDQWGAAVSVQSVSRDGWPSGMDNIFLAGSGYEPKMSAG